MALVRVPNPPFDDAVSILCEPESLGEESAGRIAMSGAVLKIRVQDLALAPSLTVACPGYELGAWRDQDLVDDVFQRHLASFALSYTEFSKIDGTSAGRALKRAAEIVYATDKYKHRGEFGELFLHAVAKDFFGAQPAISKLFYKDSDNDTVKGFDCVHVLENDESELEIWLGEAKFYADLGGAISEAVKSITQHLEQDFLKREFVAITNKLDPAWPHSQEVADLLDSVNSLDEIASSLVIPVLLTYNSDAVDTHDKICDEYIAALESEAQEAWTAFEDKLSAPLPITVHLILMPLESKAHVADLMHEKLRVWQQI